MSDLLELDGVTKIYSGTAALERISFGVRQAEILGLLGENGAGKSTLIKTVSGAIRASGGRMKWDGSTYDPESPLAAQQLGIVTIYQEFNLVNELSVAENIFLGRQPQLAGGWVDWKRMARDARQVMQRIGLNVPPEALVARLSVGQQQMVEIARALSMQARLIIMDEPTAALSQPETAQLIAVMKALRDDGVTILFVTHRLEEVMLVCDRIVVLRDGKLVEVRSRPNFDIDSIIEMMVGRQASDLHFRPQGETRVHSSKPVLSVRGLTTLKTSATDQRTPLKSVDLDLYRGEILGLAGLIGAGRTELARAIFGADPISSGRIEINGQPVRIKSPRDAIAHGIGLVNEDRKQQGLFLDQSNLVNFSVASLDRFLRLGFLVNRRKEGRAFSEHSTALGVRMRGRDQKVSLLSGGNQQKIILARWLSRKPAILIVDEPTRGIDVGAKSEVHGLLRRLAEDGIAVMVISSDLPEVLVLCDRIVTMTEGHVSGTVEGAAATEAGLMALMAPISRNKTQDATRKGDR